MSREMGWNRYQTDELDSSPQDGAGQVPWAVIAVPTEVTDVPAAEDAAGAATTSSATEAPTTSTATVKTPEAPPSAPATTRIVRRGGYRLGELVWLCLAVVDAFLALDFVFRAVFAQDTGFVNVVSRVGNALASPFTGIFSRQSLPQVDQTTFWAALVAIVIYSVAAWILLRLLTLLTGRGYYRSGRTSPR
jgi:hypothetical protein